MLYKTNILNYGEGGVAQMQDTIEVVYESGIFRPLKRWTSRRVRRQNL